MIINKKFNDIKTNDQFDDLYSKIMSKNIIILQNSFSNNQLNDIKKKLINFRKKIESSNKDRLNSKISFVRRDLNPINSKTRHIFDSYCISTYDMKNDYLFSLTSKIFDLMMNVHNKLTKKNWSFGKDSLNKGFRPQIIHYPSGGGHFDYHKHPFDPQEVGLILNISIPGKDYKSGSTVFRVDDKEIDIYDSHLQGSIAIFKYDLLHKVTEVDPGSKIDFNRGRLSAIMPIL